MSKHDVSGFITYEKDLYGGKPKVSFFTYKPNPEYWPGVVIVAPHTIQVEVPDGFNPIPLMVKDLEDQKKALRLSLANELRKIDEKISKLTCIEHTPAEVA